MRNKHRFHLAVFALFLGFSLMHSPLIGAQSAAHVVQKGDTLWDLCEFYYGDPNLWPKLWQMNPFITNPHLLKPGDVITLLEDVPIRRPVEQEIAAAEPEKREPTRPKGISVSGLTNLNAVGYLSDIEAEPWGDIFASENNRMLLAPGDTIFVRLTKQTEKIRPGDEFSIYRNSPLIKHPITGEKMGYVLSVRGRLLIEEAVGLTREEGETVPKKNIYKARLHNITRSVNIGDLIIPYEPVSPCIRPRSVARSHLGHIVAAQDGTSIIGMGTVVYIDQGLNQGVRRGDMFEVVRTHIVPDPDDQGFRLTKKAKLILPDVHIGVIIVLESRQKTATAVVISSKEEIFIGNHIKGFSWVEPPEILNKIASCPLE